LCNITMELLYQILRSPWYCVSSILVCLLYAVYLKIRPLHVDKSVPRVEGFSFPILGYLPHVIKHWHEWPSECMRLCRLFKKTWGGPLPNFGGLPGAYFYIHQEPQINYVLSNVDLFIKGDIWDNVLGELLGQGIFAVDGDKWKKHRKLMSNLFSRNLMRHNATVTRNKLLQVVRQLQKKIIAGDADAGVDVDIQDVFFRLMFDITSSVTFGTDLDSVGEEKQHYFARAFDEISFLCQQRFLDPLFLIKRYWQVGTRERRIRQLKHVIDSFVDELINDRRINLDLVKMDILSTYIESANKSGELITNDDLRDIVMNVLLAGRDTTACALSWTWYELSKNPLIVARIIKEVAEVCGKNTHDNNENHDNEQNENGAAHDQKYTFENMNKLRYTHSVALEVIRLHPPVPSDPRFATQNCTLPDGTRVPAGAGIDVCIMAVGRNEEIWGHDASEFRPERFLNEKEPSPFKYPMFNAGPRMCLGRSLALMNMKLAMSILLPLFEFQDKLGHDGEYKWTLVESMKGGFPVHVTERKASGI